MPNKDKGADGRFLPGNKAGRAAQVHWVTLRKAFEQAFDEDDITKIAWEIKEIIFNQSLPPKTRLEAMDMVLNRLLGKPKENITIDNEDALHNPDDLKIAIATKIRELSRISANGNGGHK